MTDRILALFNGAASLALPDLAEGLSVPAESLAEPLADLEAKGHIVRVISGAQRWRAGRADDETQLMRLSAFRAQAGILGFTEAEAFDVLGATTLDAKEAARALLQAMVHRGRLRPTSRGWTHVRPAREAGAPTSKPVEREPVARTPYVGPLFAQRPT